MMMTRPVVLIVGLDDPIGDKVVGGDVGGNNHDGDDQSGNGNDRVGWKGYGCGVPIDDNNRPIYCTSRPTLPFHMGFHHP